MHLRVSLTLVCLWLYGALSGHTVVHVLAPGRRGVSWVCGGLDLSVVLFPRRQPIIFPLLVARINTNTSTGTALAPSSSRPHRLPDRTVPPRALCPAAISRLHREPTTTLACPTGAGSRAIRTPILPPSLAPHVPLSVASFPRPNSLSTGPRASPPPCRAHGNSARPRSTCLRQTSSRQSGQQHQQHPLNHLHSRSSSWHSR